MIACNLTWLRAPLLSEYPRYPGALSKAFLPPQNAACGDYTLCAPAQKSQYHGAWIEAILDGLHPPLPDCGHADQRYQCHHQAVVHHRGAGFDVRFGSHFFGSFASRNSKLSAIPIVHLFASSVVVATSCAG